MMDHVKTQLWYALTVALITIVFAYIPAGLGISIWIILSVALAATGLVISFAGKRAEDVVEIPDAA